MMKYGLFSDIKIESLLGEYHGRGGEMVPRFAVPVTLNIFSISV